MKNIITFVVVAVLTASFLPLSAQNNGFSSASSPKYPGTQGSFFVNNDRTFIIDGPNCGQDTYTEIGNTVYGYPDSALIQSPEDILSVCINMEHSFLLDLDIILRCPSYSQKDTINQGEAVLKFKSQPGYQIPDGTFGGSSRFLGIPYGGKAYKGYDRMNGNDSGCDSIANPYGLGFDYCFSRNASRTLVNGQPANTPYPAEAGLANVHLDTVKYTFPPIPEGFAGAGSSCGRDTVTTVPASNREEGTGFYVPASDFTSLIGCPYNGEWKIVVHDALGVDNGWVFNWSIDFGETVNHDTVTDGIGDVSAVAANIYSSDGQIVVECAVEMPVRVYDVMGRMVASTESSAAADRHFPTGSTEALKIPVPVSGVYLVGIGNHPARKVVVVR